MVSRQEERRRRTRKKRQRVKRLEKQFELHITYLIVREINRKGFAGAAKTFGISKSLLNSWVRNRGIRVQRVVVGPDDKILVTRRTD